MTQTTTTTSPTYLERVYDRLEREDNQIERRIHEALADMSNIVADMTPGCIGENDIPATRKEPSYCDCRISSEEADAIFTARVAIEHAVNAARGAALSDTQRNLLPVRVWQDAGFDYTRGLPVTTVDLISCADFVALQALWISAGVRRADVADNIKELQRELA